LAWLILEGLGTKDLLASGQTRCFAFLIDMNRLFEMFVYRLLDQLLTDGRTRVHYQRSDRSIILDAATNQPYARVVPDVLIEAGEPGSVARLAVDAKYKLYDERKLASGDVYQSFLYAYAYGGTGRALPAALLMYPSSARSSRSVRLRVQSAQTLAGAEILALGLSIPDILAEIARGIGGPAKKAILEAIQFELGSPRPVAA
jgi:5-methylcytosine-specific restriction enzyme subunit McrC